MDPTTEMALTNPTTIKRPSPTEAQDEIDLDAIVLRNDLRLYIREAWHVVEPSTVYLENWHIDLIAEHLEAVTAGEIKRLLINMPPRQSKSTCVSIMWPTWVWTREAFRGKAHNPVLEGPGTRWIFASYADELRTKHSLDRRKMLQSEWYRSRWPKPAELTSDQNVKTLFTNSSSGQMFATTMTGGWVFLHGGGALGATGAVTGVETSLPAALAPFILPASPTGPELRSAIRASLAVLDLAPDRVTVPTLGAVWRSILGAADFSVFVYGATGRFKTALASLLQQHFGMGFAAHRLPGSWASTANFDEVVTFIAKDTLLVIDDFRPGAAERRRLEGEADRLLRAAANGAGRGRLKSNDSLRSAHPPRALILATGGREAVGGEPDRTDAPGRSSARGH